MSINSKTSGFDRKLKRDGSENPKYADLLEVDKTIAGQNYGCFSFISPEKVLKKREMFYFQEFLNKWEMNKSMEKFHQFLNFISFKYKLHTEDIMKDLDEFVKDEKDMIISSSSLEDDYKNFLDKSEKDLDTKFNIDNKFQTSTRGFKSRGNFPTQEEAELRAKMLRESDPLFDIFVGPVGTWLPWEPEAYKTGRVEYLEEELNQLVKEKRQNEDNAKDAFEKRVKESKEQAIEDNKINATKYGTNITQDLDESGNLVSVDKCGDQELAGEVSVADIRSELFSGDNVVTGTSDHGQSRLVNGLAPLIGTAK